MIEFTFDVVLSAEPDEQQADRLYGVINDGTLLTESGMPFIRFHREASSLPHAISSAVKQIRSAGFEVLRVEMTPDQIAELETASA